MTTVTNVGTGSCRQREGGEKPRGRITDAQVDDVLRDTNPRLFWD